MSEIIFLRKFKGDGPYPGGNGGYARCHTDTGVKLNKHDPLEKLADALLRWDGYNIKDWEAHTYRKDVTP